MKIARSWLRPIRGLTELLQKGSPNPAIPHPSADAPVIIEDFGPNPGHLRMAVYPPPLASHPAEPRPLLVFLHGCGQNAASFARHSGWLTLARTLQLPLLLPIQPRTNNPAGCFNWFRPQDIGRHGNEAISLMAMVQHACTLYAADPKRIFIAGLSAGGAMAATLLTAFPDMFAAGMIFAGTPAGVAVTAQAALSLMKNGLASSSDADLAAHARALAPAVVRHWPRLAIWHGMEDRTVAPLNAELLARQFLGLHGFSCDAPRGALLQSALRGGEQSWSRNGETLVSLRVIPSLGHAVPVSVPASDTPDRHAQRMAGLHAADHAAAFWGLRNSPSDRSP